MSEAQLIDQINSLPENLKKRVEAFVSDLVKEQKVEPSHSVAKRQFGLGKGSFKMSNDFDATLEDFQEYT